MSNAEEALSSENNEENKRESEQDISKPDRTYSFKLKDKSSKALSKNALKLKMAVAG